MEQVGFYFNAAACIGCKTCVIACKDKNDLEVGRNFRRVYDFEEGTFPKPRRWHLSIACNHCDSPSCVSHCPTKAMHKREEDGVVVVDHTLCVGCRYCTWACPYEAPQFDEASGMMTKCDTCLNLRAKGKTQPVWMPAPCERWISVPSVNYGKNTATMRISQVCPTHR